MVRSAPFSADITWVNQSTTIAGRRTQRLLSWLAWLASAAGATALLLGVSPDRPGPREPLSVLGFIVGLTMSVVLIGAVGEALTAFKVPGPTQSMLRDAFGAVCWIILLDARHPEATFAGVIDDRPLVCAAVIFATPLLSLLVTAVHECGHALAGLAIGLRLDTIAFGPLIARRSQGRLRLRRYAGARGSGGFVRCTQDGATPPWWQAAIVAAGGPAADLLLVGAALMVDAWMRGRGLQSTSPDVALAVLIAVIGSAAARNGVWFLMGSPDRGIIEVALKHRRPAAAKTHPSKLALYDGPVARLDGWSTLLQLRRALAHRDPTSARAFCDKLQPLLSVWSALDAEDATLDAAYVRARLQEPQSAEVLLNEARSRGVVSPAREHRARAAAMMAHGDLVGASDAAVQGLGEYTLDGGDTPLDRELLLEIKVAASDPDFAAAWLRWEKF